MGSGSFGDFSPIFLFWVVTMYILAIDQARAGAWSIFDYETKELVKYGDFDYSKSKYTYSQAIMNIEKEIEKVISENVISAIFIEDIQLRKNVQSFKRLAQLQGVLINLFEKNEYLYSFVAPTSWQSFCQARGRTTKELKSKITTLEKKEGKKESKILSIQYVKDKYNIDTLNDNLSDSICIGDYVVNNITITVKE